MKKSAEDLIIETLRDKSVHKLNVYENALGQYKIFKSVLKTVAGDIQKRIKQIDARIVVDYVEHSPFSIQIRVAGDLVIFEMHSNTFLLNADHNLWQTSYLLDKHSRAYCSIINIYNFLADSVKYKRVNDLGYLVGRLFLNEENHFFMEGKRQMGFLYNNFATDVFSQERMRDVAQSAILYSLNFDLLVPPYESMQEVTFTQINEAAQSVNSSTGKRLGFRFQHDDDWFEK